MIPNEFGYYRPDTLAEALALRRELHENGRSALWYAGGTEILSMARMGTLQPDAVIDIKALPECGVLALQDGTMHFGACATLGRVAESGVFPLLGQTVSRIADHTNQCKITLGGNLAGTIRYREASLPLWIADAQAQLAGPQGLWSVPFDSVFDGRLRLEAQALLLSFSIPEPAAKWPFVHYKFVRADKIDYPLFTLVAARDDNGLIRLALSGVCCAPLRNADMEAAINDRKGTVEQRAQAAIERLPGPVLDDHLGSAEYRLFRLGLALRDAIDTLEGHSDAKA